MNQPRSIVHCRQCGTRVHYRIPDDGDTRERAVCPACQTIHYENPLNVIGTIPVLADGRVLLCLRNIEPRRGKWTLPAGFMELGETTEQGALRETIEEAGADIVMGPLFSIVNVPYVGQVHWFYLAHALSESLNPGHETIEARFFAEDDIPWDELAFRTVKTTLTHYFAAARSTEGAKAGGVHCIDLSPQPPEADNVIK